MEWIEWVGDYDDMNEYLYEIRRELYNSLTDMDRGLVRIGFS